MNTKKYMMLIISIIISYIFIKLIDNYQVIFSILSLFSNTITPFVYGIILAYLINPSVIFFEKKIKLSRLFSVFLTICIYLLCLICFIFFIAPILLQSVVELINQFPEYIDFVGEFFTKNVFKLNKLLDAYIKNLITKQLTSLAPYLADFTKTLFTQAVNTTMSATSLIFNFVLSIIICIYTVLDKENFINYFKKINRLIF